MPGISFDLTDHGRCTGCGSCCASVIPVSDAEYDVLEQLVKNGRIQQADHHWPDNGCTVDLTCPFLNPDGGDKKCTIYDKRPYICRCYKCDHIENPGASANLPLVGAKSRNLWNLFGMTGFAQDGKPILLKNCPAMVVTGTKGERMTLNLGDSIAVKTKKDDKFIGTILLLKKDTVTIVEGKTHDQITLPFSALTEIDRP